MVTAELVIKKVDPNTVDWNRRAHGKFDPIIAHVSSMKIGEAFSVEGISNKGATSYIRKKCYQRVRGNYKLYTSRIGEIIYFRKAAK